LLGTLFGVGIVMVLVLVAANVSIGLWTRSTVDAAASDAARRIASTPPDVDVRARVAEALTTARHELGAYGRRVALDVESVGPPAVVLHVRAPGADLLPRLVRGGPVVGSIDRRIVVRREVDVP
jgi:hypothetical protein